MCTADIRQLAGSQGSLQHAGSSAVTVSLRSEITNVTFCAIYGRDSVNTGSLNSPSVIIYYPNEESQAKGVEKARKRERFFCVCFFYNLVIPTFAIDLAAILLISQRFQRLSATKATEANTVVRRTGGDLGKQ